MRLSNLVLTIVVACVLATGNAISTTSTSDQTIVTSAHTARSLRAEETNDKILLCTLTTSDANNNEGLEEERLNFGFLNNLVRGSSAKKAAKAAEAAAKQQKANQMYRKILENDNDLYTAMGVWRREGTSAMKIRNDMTAAGRTREEANTVFMRYTNFIKEKP